MAATGHLGFLTWGWNAIVALTGRLVSSSYTAFSLVRVRPIPIVGKITAQGLSTKPFAYERLMRHQTSVIPSAALWDCYYYSSGEFTVFIFPTRCTLLIFHPALLGFLEHTTSGCCFERSLLVCKLSEYRDHVL